MQVCTCTGTLQLYSIILYVQVLAAVQLLYRTNNSFRFVTSRAPLLYCIPTFIRYTATAYSNIFLVLPVITFAINNMEHQGTHEPNTRIGCQGECIGNSDDDDDDNLLIYINPKG